MFAADCVMMDVYDRPRPRPVPSSSTQHPLKRVRAFLPREVPTVSGYFLDFIFKPHLRTFLPDIRRRLACIRLRTKLESEAHVPLCLHSRATESRAIWWGSRSTMMRLQFGIDYGNCEVKMNHVTLATVLIRGARTTVELTLFGPHMHGQRFGRQLDQWQLWERLSGTSSAFVRANGVLRRKTVAISPSAQQRAYIKVAACFRMLVKCLRKSQRLPLFVTCAGVCHLSQRLSHCCELRAPVLA